MQEFRFHGRGGQGVVILGKLVARLYFQLQQHVKEFPKFGVERRGAPVEGYVRVDDEPIDLNCQIYNPDTIVVMADSILEQVDVTAGLKPGGRILVNTARPLEALAEKLAGYQVSTVDANGIALKHGLGSELAPIANTTLFGAFARMMEVDEAELDQAIKEQIKRAEANIAAAKEAYGAVSELTLLPGEPVKSPPKKALFKTYEDLPELAYSVNDARGNKTGSWRSQRPKYTFKAAPCNSTCPAGNDVRGFLQALAKDDPRRALEILLETSPFPGTCGRVCPHPCETNCNREHIDGRVSVNALERYADSHGGEIEVEVAPSTGRRVAIVGAGPAGLSAAWQLARLGHSVVVFEAAPKPGGMLVLGIPEYRLPRDVLARELERIRKVGVEIRCNKRLGEDIELKALQAEYDAVLIAVGQMISAKLRMPGEDLPGVGHGLQFLRNHNLGKGVEVGSKMIVIGGGNTAVDVAGVALRKSPTRDVSIVYRRSREQMPAIPEEVEQALAEGVQLMELVSPVEAVAGPDGRIKGLICDKMRLEAADSSGRPKPVPIPDSRHELPCDHLILATGQWTDLEFAEGLEVHADQVRTNMDKVFISGDCSTSAGTVTAAIGSGRAAAYSVHSFLGGELAKKEASWAPQLSEVLQYEKINPGYFAHRARGEEPLMPVRERLAGFREVVGEIPDGCGEAGRCLACGTCTGCDNCYIYCPEPAITRENGVYMIDLAYCKGCGVCLQECPRGIVNMSAEEA